MSSFLKNISLVLFLFISVNAAAESNSPADNNQTMFQKVADLFNGGDILDLEKFAEKVVSGRCFHIEKPNIPSAAYLVITKKLGDVGPLGSISNHYTGMMQEIAQVQPGYFDQSDIDITDKYIYPTRYPFVLKYTDSYVLNYPATGETAYFRRNDKFIASMVVDRYGQAGMVCYFFKTSSKTKAASMRHAK
jgi:hypothetical protein